MNAIRVWLARCIGVFRRAEDEMRDELDFHIDSEIEFQMERGLSRAEAHRVAGTKFGGLDRTKEVLRETRGLPFLDVLVADIRYGSRRLVASPGFTVAAVLTIALGVGLNTGIFSILNGVIFRGLPVPAAHELVAVRESVENLPGRSEKGRANSRVTTAEYRTYRERTTTLSGLMGYSVPWPVALGGAAPQQATGRYVTCTYFDVLQQPPAIGRGFSAEDCGRGVTPVVVLGHALWVAAFDADPHVIGRTLTMNRQAVTVVGVARDGTYMPDLLRLDFFAPIAAQPLLRPDREWFVSDRFGWLDLVGRRRGDREVDEVRAEFNVIAAQIDQQQPGRSTTVFVDDATTLPRPQFDLATVAVGGLVLAPFGLVLLIACANVANLCLARTTARAPEIAVRLALGASRSRVVQQVLTESVLIALVGGALGALVAFWSFDGLVAFLLSPVSTTVPALEPDLRVLTFALLLSLVTGILAGLAPALQGVNVELHAAAKQAARGGGQFGGRLQGIFVGLQVGICMVLLVAAGLLLRGLFATYSVDPGFPYRDLTVVAADLRDFGYRPEDIPAFHRRLATQVGALPGVEAVGYSARPPWEASGLSASVRVGSQDIERYRRVQLAHVSPGYFSAAGIPIVRGRTFTPAELTDTTTAVVVTEATARRLWPGADPVGQTLNRRAGDGDEPWQVVGVAKDAQVTVMGEVDPHYLYIPAPPRFQHMLSLVVRRRTGAASVAPGIQAVVRGLDQGLSMRVTPLDANQQPWRDISGIVTSVAAALGTLALLLAGVGIYGVVSQLVHRRRREIGLRIALGARARNVLGLILRRTMRPVVIGAVVGVLAAGSASRFLSWLLFGVSPVDPVGIGGAVVFVLGVALVASALPATRALQVSPTTMLRDE